MLIIIDLNFVLKGCFLCPVPLLVYHSEKFYFKAQTRKNSSLGNNVFFFPLANIIYISGKGTEELQGSDFLSFFFLNLILVTT